MGRRIYIDLGANHGHTVRSFRAENANFITFAFEPTPRLAQGLREQFAGPDTNVHVMECAAWIYDGVIAFYFGADSDESSTAVLNKRPTPGWNIDYSNGILVRSLHFSRWLLENTSDDDDIVIKMDVEGAEYKLLTSMMDSGVLSRIRELRVEWHWDRYPGEVSQDDHKRIRERVIARTNLIDWH